MNHIPASPGEIWTPIGQTSNQLILYHPPSHALSVQPHHGPLIAQTATTSASAPQTRPPLLLDYRSTTPLPAISASSSSFSSPTSSSHSPITASTCPTCLRPLPSYPVDPIPRSQTQTQHRRPIIPLPQGGRSEYFQILERAHEGINSNTNSRPSSPGPGASTIYGSKFQSRSRLKDSLGGEFTRGGSAGFGFGTDEEEENYHNGSEVAEQREQEEQQDLRNEVDEELPARGYYQRFFREEKRLGIGAEGSVYLATHVIGGNVLGSYAVKKIAVGTSKPYLLKILHEVRLLEALRHPNIIPYHHSWIDVTQFSSFGPPITALHVLMMYATAGNLDTFLLSRGYPGQPGVELSAGLNGGPGGGGGMNGIGGQGGGNDNAERIKAFRRRKSSNRGMAGREDEMRGVLYLGQEEVASLFGDVVEGLAFLHASSILHLDLKCSNVLLHWEDGRLMPKAMLSDFGTSEEMLRGHRERTGHTGTMEYMAPETLVTDQNGHYRPSDSHGDMWSLGMILHKLLFLQLPYGETADFDQLLARIQAYPGFIPTPELISSCERRYIPRDLLILLSKLVNLNPEARPTAEKVRAGIRSLGFKKETMDSSNARRRRSKLSGVVSTFNPFKSSASRRSMAPVDPGGNSTVGTGPQKTEVQPWTKPSELSSPVRPILALPSPVDINIAGPYVPVPTDNGDEDVDIYINGDHSILNDNGTTVRFLTLRWRNIRILLFVFKMMSLQPQLTGLNLHPSIVFVLVVVAIWDLVSGSRGTGSMTLGNGILHLVLLAGQYLVSRNRCRLEAGS